jgi:hypothetical protein
MEAKTAELFLFMRSRQLKCPCPWGQYSWSVLSMRPRQLKCPCPWGQDSLNVSVHEVETAEVPLSMRSRQLKCLCLWGWDSWSVLVHEVKTAEMPQSMRSTQLKCPCPWGQDSCSVPVHETKTAEVFRSGGERFWKQSLQWKCCTPTCVTYVQGWTVYNCDFDRGLYCGSFLLWPYEFSNHPLLCKENFEHIFGRTSLYGGKGTTFVIWRKASVLSCCTVCVLYTV